MKTKFIAKLFEHGVVQIAETHSPFRLASGKTSLLYLDHRKIFSVPELRRGLAEMWGSGVERYLVQWGCAPFNVCFAGTATAGIVPAYLLADYFSAGFIYVRKQSKGHGLGQSIEGYWDKKMPLVIVDDMCTTGGSLQTALDILNNACAEIPHAKVVGACAITARDSYQGPADVPFCSLFRVGEIIEALKRLGFLSPEQHKQLCQENEQS